MLKRSLQLSRLRRLLSLLALASLPACTLLLDKSKDQCSSAADCATFGADYLCVQGVCAPPGAAGAAGAGGAAGAAGAGDGGSAGMDNPGGTGGTGGASGAGAGGQACTPKTPKTDRLDFLNEKCTSAQCFPFDNCAIVNFCGGELPALVPPPKGGQLPMRLSPALVAFVLCASLSAPAMAQKNVPTVDCASLPNPVYLTGSSALQNFVKVVGKLVANDSTPSTVVYQSQGSCVGVQTIFDADPTKRVIKDIPANGSKAANYAIFVKADGSTQECFLKPEGTPVSVGISDVYASSCGYTAPAGVDIADYFGPVQSMTFVVPAASTQRAISAEAAYLAFGTGAAGPWSDPQYFFIRNSSSGTQQMISTAIGVPATGWWGVDRGGSGGVRDQLKVVADLDQAGKAIGILSSDVADPERANLKILAFQARGQDCGYLPDSTPTARDKQNVRDGHYEIWGPSHLFARTTNGTAPAEALPFLSRFVVPKIPVELLDAEISGALVPQCAMQVTRSEEVGPLASYQPPYSCGCYFDLKTRGSTGCQACASDQECPASAPSCNFGYCEVQ